MQGYLRSDGRKGIRNIVAVAYLVECAHHVSRLIVQKAGTDDVHLIGFPGCYPNAYSLQMMKQLCTHPNVGAVLLVSLGCEGFNRESLQSAIAASGRPVELLVIQQAGGTLKTLNAGIAAVKRMREMIANTPMVPMRLNELVVGHDLRWLGRHQRTAPQIPLWGAASMSLSKQTQHAFSKRPASSSAASESWPIARSLQNSVWRSTRA